MNKLYTDEPMSFTDLKETYVRIIRKIHNKELVMTKSQWRRMAYTMFGVISPSLLRATTRKVNAWIADTMRKASQ